MKTWPGRERRWPHNPRTGEFKLLDRGGCKMSMVLSWLVAINPPNVTDGPADVGKGAGRVPLGGL